MLYLSCKRLLFKNVGGLNMKNKVIFTGICAISVFITQYLYSLFIVNSISDSWRTFTNVLLQVVVVNVAYFVYGKVFKEENN